LIRPALSKAIEDAERGLDNALGGVGGEKAGARGARFVAAGVKGGGGGDVTQVFVGQRNHPRRLQRRGGLDVQRGLAEKFRAVGNNRQIVDAQTLNSAGNHRRLSAEFGQLFLFAREDFFPEFAGAQAQVGTFFFDRALWLDRNRHYFGLDAQLGVGMPSR